MTDGRIVSDLMIQQSLDICLFLRTCDFASDFPLSLLTDLSDKFTIKDVPDQTT